ncbi:hypothetical protein [Numidum massiliense]|uniref:hypothetical protein n=1 Tax=Numidum massiliense TaxID=1522315 RepID=UPI0006D55C39|nr:hypothetical protein [Numidum massiliense]
MRLGLYKTLTEQPFSLMVSLPRNDLDLAQAAFEGGADIVKVHINVDHRASGNSFGTLRENEDFLSQLVAKASKRLTGIVVGDGVHKVTESDIERLKEIGIGFISLYAHDTPPWLLQNRVDKMIAISSEDPIDYGKGYKSLQIDALEASVIPGEEYGSPLTLRDIFLYERIVRLCERPVVVPTQRKVTTKDVSSLVAAGVKGLMIGAIVTGKEVDSLYKATRAFRTEIDRVIGGGTNEC